MSVSNIVSNGMRELLPPCLEPMMKEAVQLIKDFKGQGSWGLGKPIGMLSNYEMTVDIKDSVKLFVDTSREYLGRVATITFTNEALKPGVSGIHQFWQEGSKSCESLAVSGSTEMLIDCYGGPFEGRLISQVCSGYPDNSISASQVIGGIAGAIGLYQAVQELRDGNKVRALTCAAMGVAAFVLPNVKSF